MKKKEVIFILGILVFAGVLWGALSLIRRGSSDTIRITVDGELYGTYPLNQDQIIPIGDTNVCRIKDGKATMIEAQCPDHLCLRQGPVGTSGGTIVCLPNKIVIEGELTDSDESDGLHLDAAV